MKSSPVVAGEIVLVGSYDTHLYALDAKTGAVRWVLRTDGPVHSTAAVQNGVIYLGGCDERFRAVRLADGKVLFVIPLGAYTGASTLVDGTHAYVGTFDNDVVGIDLTAKKSLAVQGEGPRISVLIGGARRRRVMRREPRQGAARDRRGHGEGSGKSSHARVDSSPAVAGGRVVVGSSDGKLYILDAHTGRQGLGDDAGDALTASPRSPTAASSSARRRELYCFG